MVFQSISFSSPLAVASTTIVVLYLAYVRAVRYRRRDAIESLPDPLVAGYPTARKIYREMNLVEFAFLSAKCLNLGLFRTYGIPTISKTLAATKELTHNVGRRYDDTDLIIREFLERESDDDERVRLAIGRMNYLHSKYKISNGDYLYTLSVFICEPLRWIDKYEFRKLTKNERHAQFVYWREIGIRMGIKDIPPTLEEMFKFNEEYELKYMKYADSNRKVADATVALFLSLVPNALGLRKAGDAIVRSLLDQRLLDTFAFQPAPVWLQKVSHTVLVLRGYFIRYFMLPRSAAPDRTPAEPMKGSNPRRFCPIYNEYEVSYPNGYRVETLGPKKFENDPTVHKYHEPEPETSS